MLLVSAQSVLVLSVLLFGPEVLGHGLLPRGVPLRDERVRSVSTAGFDDYYYIENETGSGYGCSVKKLAALKTFIDEARELASAASSFLEQGGSELSPAYMLWFGAAEEGNAKPATREAIRTHHYEAVLQYLKPPSPENYISWMIKDFLSPTGLTYACPPKLSEECRDPTVAGAHDKGDDGWAVDAIMLCPSLFKRPSHEAMVEQWRQDRTLDHSAGFALLQAAQHLSRIVGESRKCGNVPDPEAPGRPGGCSRATCCASLSDADKIKNSRNMAFFALEVAADSSRGEPPELSR
ncbi:hypothetical protein CTA1_11519 [Colletotrichum tanaceti]|uniref:Uncharacterized protein n=1 Tax=Colletotrichum tanaceti TaxID=1306861 RepID=A0A4U6XPM4_9PEZI|nr:hypothetical protein CTA1_11519 [Colletotrichum tanaceti]